MKFFSRKIKSHEEAFTLLEVIIAISVVVVGLVAVAALGTTTIVSTRISKNDVIAENLAREGMELIRYVRDTNWEQQRPFTECLFTAGPECPDLVNGQQTLHFINRDPAAGTDEFVDGNIKFTTAITRVVQMRGNSSEDYLRVIDDSVSVSGDPVIDIDSLDKIVEVELDSPTSRINKVGGIYCHTGDPSCTDPTIFRRVALITAYRNICMVGGGAIPQDPDPSDSTLCEDFSSNSESVPTHRPDDYGINYGKRDGDGNLVKYDQMVVFVIVVWKDRGQEHRLAIREDLYDWADKGYGVD